MIAYNEFIHPRRTTHLCFSGFCDPLENVQVVGIRRQFSEYKARYSILDDSSSGSEKPIFSIDELAKKLRQIRDMGWVPNRRPGNQGGAGNTLEDLLGIKENNFQAPDYGPYELKTHTKGGSYLTLFHQEPANNGYVKNLLPLYGWKHKTLDEWRISITVSGKIFTGRGFRVVVDRINRQVRVDFDIDKVKPRADYKEWLGRVRNIKPGRTAMSSLWDATAVQEAVSEVTSAWEGPVWPFDLLERILYNKIYNLVVVRADKRKSASGVDEYRYTSANIYERTSLDSFLDYIERGYIYIDFDARTRHNHGVKYRLDDLGLLVPLYETVATLM